MLIDARAAVLGVARSLTWVRETQGPNRGEVVNAFLRAVHMEPGAPWCVGYVNGVGHAVLWDRWPLPMVAGCATLGQAAAERGLLREEPAVGAIFLEFRPLRHRFAHTGFLIRPAVGGGWHTIEGNASPAGSPEGTGVFERVRHFAEHDRFVHWWAAEPAA